MAWGFLGGQRESEERAAQVMHHYDAMGGETDGNGPFHTALGEIPEGRIRQRLLEDIARKAALRQDPGQVDMCITGGAFRGDPEGLVTVRSTCFAALATQRAAQGDEAGRRIEQAKADNAPRLLRQRGR